MGSVAVVLLVTLTAFVMLIFLCKLVCTELVVGEGDIDVESSEVFWNMDE